MNDTTFKSVYNSRISELRDRLERSEEDRKSLVVQNSFLAGDVERLKVGLSVAEKGAAEAKNGLMASEEYRRKYADGKYSLYAMGGEFTEAAVKHLPWGSEGPLERYTRKIEREHSPLLEANLADLAVRFNDLSVEVSRAIPLFEKAIKALEVPAAEHVPAICEAWDLIEAGLKELR